MTEWLWSTGDYRHIQAGDIVYRQYLGHLMKLTVASVDDEIIYTTGGWMFARDTGFEHDPQIGVGAAFGTTISQLVPAPE